MYADMLTPARDSYMVSYHYKVAMPAGVVSAQAFVTAKNADPLLAGYKFYINGDFVDLGPGTSDVNNIDDSSISGGFFCYLEDTLMGCAEPLEGGVGSTAISVPFEVR